MSITHRSFRIVRWDHSPNTLLGHLIPIVVATIKQDLFYHGSALSTHSSPASLPYYKLLPPCLLVLKPASFTNPYPHNSPVPLTASLDPQPARYRLRLPERAETGGPLQRHMKDKHIFRLTVCLDATRL